MTTRELQDHLIAFKEGNLLSFRYVYQRYYHQVFYFCLSFTKSRLDAEELASDVFVQIWKRRAIIDPNVPLKPLLFKISRDVTWKFLRKVSSRRDRRDAYLRHYARQHTTDGEGEVIFQEYLTRLDKAMTHLTPQQRKVFTLRYLKGRDLTQIANELQISKNTVKVHLANGKRSVLNYLPLRLNALLLLPYLELF